MDCKLDKNIIQKYIDNTIDPLELIILREHIVVCQECKQELELMSKLEDSMYSYFSSLPDNKLLDDFTLNVLEHCYVESGKTSFGKELTKAWGLNKIVARNAVRYTKYLPGSKLASNTAKKASRSINKAIRGYMKNSLRKLITSSVK